MFQCTSYTVACLLAQNTKYGDEGVEWNIAIGVLCERPVKSIEEWREIATNLVEYFSKEYPSDKLEKIVCDYGKMKYEKLEEKGLKDHEAVFDGVYATLWMIDETPEIILSQAARNSNFLSRSEAKDLTNELISINKIVDKIKGEKA